MPGKIEGKRRRGDRGWDGWVASLTPNRHEFEQTLGDSEGQGIWAFCSPWDYKESNKTEGLNNNNLSPLNLVLLLVFCLFFWAYYSVASFYLICCFYSYAFGSLVTFPNLEEVPPCRRCFMCPRSTLSHQIFALGVTPVCAAWVFMCDGLTTVGTLPGVPGLWCSWLPHPILSGGLCLYWAAQGHKAAGCRASGSSSANAGPLMGRFRFLDLVLAC